MLGATDPGPRAHRILRMAQTVRIEERARLEAIVFGRSTATEAERAAATAALRELLAPAAVPPPPTEVVAEPEAPVEWSSAVPAVSRTPVLPRVAVAVLAGLALVTAVANTPVPAPFADSLGLFEHPQRAADILAAATRVNLPGAGPDLDPATVRVVPEQFPEIDVLAYRTVNGDVCLALLFADGGGGSCATEADFRARGLAGGTLFPPSGWTYSWGPRGDPRISAPGS